MKEKYVICQKGEKSTQIYELGDGVYVVTVDNAQINIKPVEKNQIKILPDDKLVKKNIFDYFRRWMAMRHEKREH